jgi:hypothetical protein
MPSVPAHVTPLLLVQPAAADPARAVHLLVERAGDWLGSPVSGAADGRTRYLTDLRLPLREHSPSLVFRKAAYVDLGAVRTSPGRCDIEIEWRSASLAPLFPVFAGHLIVTNADLRLEGYYAPPAGELGAVLDRAFLNIAARGTARWFLGRAMATLDPAAARSWETGEAGSSIV